MHWILIAAGACALLIVLAKLREHARRAPPIQHATDAFPVTPRFLPAGESQPVPFDRVIAGTTGAIAVESPRDGWAVLFAMNSAGGMFPCSEPTRIAPGGLVELHAWPDRGPHRFTILPADRHQHPVGGGTIFAVVACASRESVERYVEHGRRYRAYWPLADLPHAARIELAEPERGTPSAGASAG